jgi:hypothetical protein
LRIGSGFDIPVELNKHTIASQGEISPDIRTRGNLPLLQIALASAGTAPFVPGLPVLQGTATEQLFPPAEPAGHVGAVVLFRADDWLLGAANAQLRGTL